MKFAKIDLLTLLISLFLFASCENTSTIGMEIDPNMTVEGTLVDTLTVTSRTLADDNISTLYLNRHPLGYLNDPIFGTTESSLAMEVGLPAEPYTIGTSPTLDSAILVLNYGSEFYGDSTQVYTFEVHQLTSAFSEDETFLNNRTYPYQNTVIGTRTSRLFPNTKFKVTDIVVGAADTLKSVTPQIRIKLDPNFIEQNLFGLAETSLKTNSVFKRYFNGFHVKVNAANPTGNGAMTFIDFAEANSSLSLYYKKKTSDEVTDTVNVDFPIGSTTNRVAASIKHNYSGTPVETQLNNPNQQYSVTYLQPLVGLKNKISFPGLDNFSNSVGKIVINKAELIVGVNSGTDVRPFVAAPRLSLYRYDIAEQRTNIEVFNSDAASIGGVYDATKKQYVFNVTLYIQNLISKKTKDYGTFLAPTPSGEFSITPSVSSAARTVIGSHKKNPSAGENVMKLNIYYTSVK